MSDKKTKVILCGNPNTGKTTLFNTMAKANEKASNWHGVTVGVKEKVFQIESREFVLCDLPGIYSLEGVSKEEEIARNFLYENKNDSIVVCVLDANNLKRNLLLALELKEICPSLIMAVNMANEVKCFNVEKLEAKTGAKVFGVDARKKKSVNKLKDEILKQSENLKPLKENKEQVSNLISTAIINRLDVIEKKIGDKFKLIDEILKESGYDKINSYGQSKIDKVLLSRFFAPIIFIMMMGLVFFITFGFIGESFGALFQSLMQGVSEEIINLLMKIIKSDKIVSFINEGVIKGVLNVLSFLPQITLMSFCLNLLEDFGYLSRVAFMFDGALKKIGLTGRSLFSLVMGFGCTTSAVLTTRNLNGEKLREKTVLLLPYVSCSAKLPIYSVICSVFFAKYKALFVFLLYIFALFIMIIAAYIINLFCVNSKKEYYIMEMPKLRIPTFKKVFIDSLSVAKSFVKKVGGAILIVSVIIYILYNYKLDFSLTNGYNESIMTIIASKFAFLFKPLGFGIAGAVVAIVSGLIAKEMVVSSLAIINGCMVSELSMTLINPSSNVYFTSLSAVSFLVFILLYSPCISSLVVMKKEFNVRVMLKSFAMQSLVAYAVSFVVYNLGLLILGGLWWVAVLLLISLAALMFVVIKLIKKHYCVQTKNLCLDCKGVCNGDFCLQGKRD